MVLGHHLLAGDAAAREGRSLDAIRSYNEALYIALFKCMWPVDHPSVAGIQRKRQECFRSTSTADKKEPADEHHTADRGDDRDH